MNLMATGKFAGIGQGVAQLGGMAMQGAMEARKLDQTDKRIDKWAHAGLFRRVGPRILDEMFGMPDLQGNPPNAQGTMQQIQKAPMVRPSPALASENRMLPEDVTTAGPMALARARQWRP